MTYDAFCRAVAARTGGSIRQTRRVLDAARDELTETLFRGDRVRWPGLGTFDARFQQERTLRSIQDRRQTPIDARWMPTFKASRVLRARLRERTPVLYDDPAHRRAWSLALALLDDLQLYHSARLPQLARGLSETELEQVCERAIGQPWRNARQTFDRQVPPGVRTERDHLTHEARRLWAAT